MVITDIDVSLKGLRVGLSGAVPDRSEWDEPAQDRAILEFVSLLSGLVFKYDGHIIHGSHPTFTPVIVHQAELHADRSRERKPATLFMSELWEKELDLAEREWFERVADLNIVPQVGTGGPNDAETRNRSLSALRRPLVASMDVMVVVGGKQHATDGLTPGVTEELTLAKERRLPCFLVGGLGGMAAELARRQDSSDGGFALNNGLDVRVNEELMTSQDVAACVGLIFEHLVHRLPSIHPALEPIEPPPAVPPSPPNGERFDTSDDPPTMEA